VRYTVGGAVAGMRQIVRSVVSKRNGKGAVWARTTTAAAINQTTG
jgi:hypothetical protein